MPNPKPARAEARATARPSLCEALAEARRAATECGRERKSNFPGDKLKPLNGTQTPPPARPLGLPWQDQGKTECRLSNWHETSLWSGTGIREPARTGIPSRSLTCQGASPHPSCGFPAWNCHPHLKQTGALLPPNGLPRSAPGVSTRGRTEGRWNPDKVHIGKGK